MLTYALQIVTSDNMALEEHIGLTYNALVMQVGNSNSAWLCTITSFLPALLAQLIPNTTATHAITYTFMLRPDLKLDRF